MSKESYGRYVAVYGTLKEGFGNHRVLGDCPKIGDFYTSEQFGMINGGFPVVVPLVYGMPGNSLDVVGRVAVEVYELPNDERDTERLAKLDGLEGHSPTYPVVDSMYVRIPVRVEREDIEPFWVDMYVSFDEWGNSWSVRHILEGNARTQWQETGRGVYTWERVNG